MSRTRWSTAFDGSVMRTAPWTAPSEATGMATYTRLVSSVSERRVPTARSPSRAAAISGRVE